ncbi:glycosyltransferase [Flagellimonas eckloniae]|uniref:Glycosyl transferase family 1 domain-containing protein n=1 Tax=Flagellimonas eckloniae TaxID=346185 RepID=A0A0N8WFQ3_9FLAO|nr:glycosyltransferase [Allomuricauda eckloniae]KQC29339.1 hypothetical protein AAY42_05035 [Allomuricauda eckloniae]
MRTKKNITFFVNPMGYGTLGKYDYNILSNIEKHKTLYLCNTQTQFSDFDGDIKRIYDYSSKRGLGKIWSYLKSQSLLLKMVGKYKPRSIHFQWLKIPYLDFFLLLILNSKKIKTILTVHNVLPHGSGNKYHFIYKKIYSKVNTLIAHTDRTKEELSETFNVKKDKIEVIPHGTFKTEGLNRSEINIIKEQLLKNEGLQNKTVFGALGRINPYKGIELIVDAWMSISTEERNKMHLIIAGEGESPVLNTLQGADNTTIINKAVSNEEFYAFLEISDYVLLPYLKISQSGFLLTALNEKKRVIVSDKGGLTEPFRFGSIGYVLDDLKVETLKNTILKATKNKEKHPDEKVWSRIFDYYDWKSIAKMTEKLY